MPTLKKSKKPNRKKPIFYGLYIKIDELIELGYFDTMTEKKQEHLMSLFEEYEKKNKLAFLRFISGKNIRSLRQAYKAYTNRGFAQNNKGLRGWRLEKVKPRMREALKSRILHSLSLIKTQNEQRMQSLKGSFLNWIFDRHARGKEAGSLRTSLNPTKELAKRDRHVKMILGDQTRKLLNNFDAIVAEEYQALGFFWRTRRDDRVVGNPTGKYPGRGNKKHEDHFHRQNKFYFYHNTWAIKKKLINTKTKNFKWADFEDGMPGQPINCRCHAYNIYELEDVPKEFLSEDGVKFLEKN